MKRIITFALLLSTIISCSMLVGKKKNIAIIETNYGVIKVQLLPEIAPKTVENFIGLATGEKTWLHPLTQDPVNDKAYYDGLSFHRVIPKFMIQGGCPIGNGTGGPGYTFEDETYEKLEILTGSFDTDADARIVMEEIIRPYLQKNRQDADKRVLEIVKQCREMKSGKPIMEHPVEFYMDITGAKPVYRRGKLNAHIEYGSMCMANAGPNTNGSQFFIVTKHDGCEWLDGKHTVFGKVIEGMEVVHEIENLPRDENNKPLSEHKPIMEKIKII